MKYLILIHYLLGKLLCSVYKYTSVHTYIIKLRGELGTVSAKSCDLRVKIINFKSKDYDYFYY